MSEVTVLDGYWNFKEHAAGGRPAEHTATID